MLPAAKSGFRNDELFGSSNHGKTESWSSAADDAAGKRECFISKFPRVVGRKKNSNNNNPFGRIENCERVDYSSTLKKRIEKEMAEECLGVGGFNSNLNSINITNTSYIYQQRKSFSGAIQCHVSSSSTKPSHSSSSSSSSFSRA
ncbi:hypothetical protein LINGRAHAP2_LOCUS36504 [Linum grandiflorum]